MSGRIHATELLKLLPDAAQFVAESTSFYWPDEESPALSFLFDDQAVASERALATVLFTDIHHRLDGAGGGSRRRAVA